MMPNIYRSSEVPERIIRHSQNVEFAFTRRFRVGHNYDLIYSHGAHSRRDSLFRGAIWHLCHIAWQLLDREWSTVRLSEEQNCQIAAVFGLYHFLVQTFWQRENPEATGEIASTYHHFHATYLKIEAPYRTDKGYLDTLRLFGERYGHERDFGLRHRWKGVVENFAELVSDINVRANHRDRAAYIELGHEIIYGVLASVAYTVGQEEFRRVYSMFYRTTLIKKAALQD